MATKKDTSNPIPYNVRLKIIRDRLDRARRFNRSEQISKPAKVKAAEKVVSEWSDRVEEARQARYEKHMAKVREIENALILGDCEKLVSLLTAIGA